MILKNILFFILFVFVGFVVFMSVQIGLHRHQKKQSITSPIPASLFSMEHAPTDSIQGTISTMSGVVEWQSRIATEPAALAAIKPLQQGESIHTKANGQATLQFPQIGSITIHSNTTIDIIQTLPTSAVFNQSEGRAEYLKQGITPIGIKTLGLITQLASGSASITVNKESQTVSVNVKSGSATTAFTDENNDSTVSILSTGDVFLFNNISKSGRIE